MRKAVITVGLGFGDEGKGASTDFLARRLKADLVIRYSGGSQCGHNVQLPDGRRHTFSQFGSGTLAGVPTYLGPQVIVNPNNLRAEGKHLITEMGVSDPYKTLSIDSRCLVSTIFHQRLNQLRELNRDVPSAEDSGRHGSCGQGIGETRKYWLDYGDDAIIMNDFKDLRRLTSKMELLKQRSLIEMSELIHAKVKFAETLTTDYMDEIGSITSRHLAKWCIEQFDGVNIVDECPSHLMAIYEGAQGVLLDEWHGFYPYTTWSTVTPHFAFQLADEVGTDAVSVLGLTRAYSTRHGVGPFPTISDALTNRWVDPGNPTNLWQGSFACGWLDFELLKYGINICRPDGIVVNHLDQIGDDFQICDRYCHTDSGPRKDDERWCPDTTIWQEKRDRPTILTIQQQKSLTWCVSTVEALYRPSSRTDLLNRLREFAPIAVEGSGPTHQDRQLLDLIFRK